MVFQCSLNTYYCSSFGHKVIPCYLKARYCNFIAFSQANLAPTLVPDASKVSSPTLTRSPDASRSVSSTRIAAPDTSAPTRGKHPRVGKITAIVVANEVYNRLLTAHLLIFWPNLGILCLFRPKLHSFTFCERKSEVLHFLEGTD